MVREPVVYSSKDDGVRRGPGGTTRASPYHFLGCKGLSDANLRYTRGAAPWLGFRQGRGGGGGRVVVVVVVVVVVGGGGGGGGGEVGGGGAGK